MKDRSQGGMSSSSSPSPTTPPSYISTMADSPDEVLKFNQSMNEVNPLESTLQSCGTATLNQNEEPNLKSPSNRIAKINFSTDQSGNNKGGKPRNRVGSASDVLNNLKEFEYEVSKVRPAKVVKCLCA